VSARARGWFLLAWAVSVVAVLALNLLVPPTGAENAWPWITGMMASPVAAAIILARRPGNGVGRALWVVGTATLVSFALSWPALHNPTASFAPLAEVISGAWVMPMFTGIVAVLYLFPTGSTLGGWHARVLVALWIVTGAAMILFAISSDSVVATRGPNPLAILPASADRVVQADAWFGILPLFAVLGVISLAIRWRRAGSVERAQLRWFVTGAAVFLLMLVMVFSSGDEEEVGLVFVLSSAFVILALWAIPAAIVVAILRYRLFDIDRLISRTVSYALMVGVLAAVFAAITVGLPQLLGLPDDSPLLVAVATLSVAALFNAIRRRVQSIVDRRFNRARYDAEHEVEAFTKRLSATVDWDSVADDLIGVVARTMQPVATSLWIRSRE
jgi:hypothetical protein